MDENKFTPDFDSLTEEESVSVPFAMPEEENTSERLDSPTEPFTPIHIDDDPLQDAQSLPTLFPEEEVVANYAPDNATVVTREHKPNTKPPRFTTKKVCLSILKWVSALLLAIAILACGLIAYLTVAEYNPDYAEKAQSGSVQISAVYQSSMPLRIVTFNTGYGALGEDADFFMDGGESVTPESEEYIKTNMLGMEKILKKVNADIILLQEVDTDSKRSYGLNQWLQYEFDLADYESRFALNYSCKYVPFPISFDMIGKVNSGVATYSRFDIVSATRYSLPNSFSWPTRVANLKRCLLVTRIQIDDLATKTEDSVTGPQLVLINVHLDAYDDGDGREAQFKALQEMMEEEYAKGNYVIVGGDFNQTFPNCDKYPVIQDENFVPGLLPKLRGGWQYQYDESTPTSRLLNEPYDPSSRNTQYYVIDGFIVSPNVKVNSIRTLNEGFVYSDHNPVVMDIELK